MKQSIGFFNFFRQLVFGCVTAQQHTKDKTPL
jgi:hypothetical protein